MSNEIENLLPYVEALNENTKDLIKKHFPGALTLVLEKSLITPDYITSGFNTVGIRLPNNQIFKEICETAAGHVLATTSANLSDQPAAITYEQAKAYMANKADLIIEDFGQSAQGLESTVVLVSQNQIKTLRQGAILL